MNETVASREVSVISDSAPSVTPWAFSASFSTRTMAMFE